MKIYQGLAYLLAASTQTVIIFLLAWFINTRLDKSYPQQQYWPFIVYSVGAVIILVVWVNFLRALLPGKSMNRSQEDDES